MEISQERIRRIIKEELADAHQRRPDVLEDLEGQRVKRHLEKISGIVGELPYVFEDDDDVPEWIQEKIAVIAAMLQTILDYKNDEDVRSK